MPTLIVLVFPEPAPDQLPQRIERGARVRTHRTHRNEGSLSGYQHEHAHDALAVDRLAVLLHLDLTLETVRRLHELRRRPGVHAELVEDLELGLTNLGAHHRSTLALLRAHARSAPSRLHLLDHDVSRDLAAQADRSAPGR